MTSIRYGSYDAPGDRWELAEHAEGLIPRVGDEVFMDEQCLGWKVIKVSRFLHEAHVEIDMEPLPKL